MIQFDILSDPICPWCYIGKTQFDRALARRPAFPAAVQWHPFQLNPEMPAGGMDRRAYLEAKFGGRERAVETYANIARHAEAAGLEMDFGAIARTPNTLDAHRLIHWAGLESRQNAAVDALFAAYFQQGRDIGEREVLADIADGIGMDAAVVQRLLASDADLQEIRDRDAQAREMGVTSVPTFIIAGQHAVPGAHPEDMWLKVFDEIAQQ